MNYFYDLPVELQQKIYKDADRLIIEEYRDKAINFINECNNSCISFNDRLNVGFVNMKSETRNPQLRNLLVPYDKWHVRYYTEYDINTDKYVECFYLYIECDSLFLDLIKHAGQDRWCSNKCIINNELKICIYKKEYDLLSSLRGHKQAIYADIKLSRLYKYKEFPHLAGRGDITTEVSFRLLDYRDTNTDT